MGIRAQISDKPVTNGDSHDHDIEIVIDNGGGGGGTFQANVYFEYDSKFFTITDKKGAVPKSGNSTGTTATLVWNDQAIKWSKNDQTGAETGVSFSLTLSCSQATTGSEVKAWGYTLVPDDPAKPNGPKKEGTKSNVAPTTLVCP